MEAYPTNVSQGGDDLMEMRNMARSNGSETWNEDVAVLTDYIETNAKALGKVTVMTLNGYIRSGSDSVMSQNSIYQGYETTTKANTGTCRNSNALYYQPRKETIMDSYP